MAIPGKRHSRRDEQPPKANSDGLDQRTGDGARPATKDFSRVCMHDPLAGSANLCLESAALTHAPSGSPRRESPFRASYESAPARVASYGGVALRL
jgi:hypothetical protein